MHGNRLMLIIAIAAGVMATVLAFTYINSATSALEEQQAEPMIPVLFVKNDLPANHLIDPDEDLRIEQIGASSTPGLARAAIKADEKEAVRDQRTNGPIPAGMPLLYSHLATIQDIDIAPGARAMSIPVGDSGMFGGILVPGDRVDILVSYELEEPQRQPGFDASGFDANNPEASLGAIFSQAFSQSSNPSRWEVEEVLSNIRVIAIDNQLRLSRQQQLYGLDDGLGGLGGSVVTIEVTPAQAKRLIKALAGGGNKLSLLLRPPTGSQESGLNEGSLTEGG